MFAKVVLVAMCLICAGDGGRILGIVPTPSYSHQVAFQPIWKELSLRGHQVTTLTTNPIGDPLLVNLTEIDMSFSYDAVRESTTKLMAMGESMTGLRDAMLGLVTMLDNQLQHAKVQEILKSDAHFDLVMLEYWNPSMIAFAEKFKCPHIGILSTDATDDIHKQFGNPTHPILYPSLMKSSAAESTVLDRLLSAFYSFAFSYFVMQPMQEFEQALIIEKHFGVNHPSIQTMMKNTSLLFVNSDPIFHYVRPFVPAVIRIGGGLHRTEPKPLPKELKKILDDASSGFIYFSLGSNVKSNAVPLKIRNEMLAAFAELPYTVLWKFESDELPDKPSNVYISKWLPQQDILKHPNIKLFITQGGLQSMDEAIYDHIPMVGIPYFGDQQHNVQKMVVKGFGLGLDHNVLEKETFKQTILEVINNPKYRNRVKELAELASDQPMTGLERAVWWTEYVLRHKGAKHLRSPALDIPWYQFYLLDVIAVLALASATLMCVLYVLIKSVMKCVTFCCSKLKTKAKTH